MCRGREDRGGLFLLRQKRLEHFLKLRREVVTREKEREDPARRGMDVAGGKAKRRDWPCGCR